jgi:hypothetical protein
MKELWIAEAMDLLQEEVPVMTDEHAKDLADDLYEVCGTQPVQLAVMRFFCAMPGWPGADGVYMMEAATQNARLEHDW